MRIAVRADETTDATQQETGGARGHLVSTLEAVVSTTEDRMDERAKDVENVIKAAAEPDSGEFMVPLLPERCGDAIGSASLGRNGARYGLSQYD
jgi:hypothetical protein